MCIEIAKERNSQDRKFPQNGKNTLAEWMLILSEEVGEAAKEACDTHFHPTPPEEVRTRILWRKLRYELIQVAAVTIVIIEWIDKKIG
ncbi:MAG: hypothetical protein EKK48_12180 [Candidatus Melainabacteria bacterium]|nr:MAG: hypothetical protein EKK48_12180 [Candidatus Melainabacteria bacterium]